MLNKQSTPNVHGFEQSASVDPTGSTTAVQVQPLIVRQVSDSTPIVPASSNSRSAAKLEDPQPFFLAQQSHGNILQNQAEKIAYDHSLRVMAQSPNSSLLMIGSGEPGTAYAPGKDHMTSFGTQVLISEPGQIMSDKKCVSVPKAFQTIQGPSTGKHSSKTSQMLSGDRSLEAHYMNPPANAMSDKNLIDPEEAYL